jgi:hypothetical protein
MLLTIQADGDWKPHTAVSVGGEVAVGYTCPRCQRVNEIRLQPLPSGENVETELWCHPCGRGTPASVFAS